ncbi:MAG: hypothetical protein HGJ93_06405 [Desulfosarcina sp.]|nr:hypothetical protein [Desulfosarcina sp.]MBC2765579.1 hypothetical protein [Desulfosarcina sp.]
MAGGIQGKENAASTAAGKYRPSASQLLKIESLKCLLKQRKFLFKVGFVRIRLEVTGNGGIIASLHFRFDAVALEIEFDVHRLPA